MKAVVVEIDGKNAIVLNGKGEFVKIKNNGQLKVGYETEIQSKVVTFNKNVISKGAGIAAAFLIFMGAGAGAYTYNTPYSYVNVDINPSVEITANRYDRIIATKALNEDGKKVLLGQDFKNEKINVGVEGLIKSASDKGYFKADVENAVMVTVSSKTDDKVAQIQSEVKITTSAEIKKDNINSNVIIEKVTLQRHAEAEIQGISPGKLLLIERLKAVDTSASVEEEKNKPVRDILKEIIEARKATENNSAAKVYVNVDDKVAVSIDTKKTGDLLENFIDDMVKLSVIEDKRHKEKELAEEKTTKERHDQEKDKEDKKNKDVDKKESTTKSSIEKEKAKQQLQRNLDKLTEEAKGELDKELKEEIGYDSTEIQNGLQGIADQLETGANKTADEGVNILIDALKKASEESQKNRR